MDSFLVTPAVQNAAVLTSASRSVGFWIRIEKYERKNLERTSHGLLSYECQWEMKYESTDKLVFFDVEYLEEHEPQYILNLRHDLNLPWPRSLRDVAPIFTGLGHREFFMVDNYRL